MANNLATFDYYNIFQQMNDIEKYFNKNFKYIERGGKNMTTGKTNVFIEDGSLIFEVYVAGFSKSDISINIDNSTLTITGKSEESEAKNKRYVMREIAPVNKFYRNFSLPQGLNLDAVDAVCNSGVLTVSFPYKLTETNQTRSVTIS